MIENRFNQFREDVYREQRNCNVITPDTWIISDTHNHSTGISRSKIAHYSSVSSIGHAHSLSLTYSTHFEMTPYSQS